MSEIVVREAAESDLGVIAAVYDEQVARSISTFDVEPRAVGTWAERLHSPAPGDHMLVATIDEGVVGSAYSTAYRARPAYDRTRETSVYLAEAARGRGIGRVLYDALLARLREDDVHVALAVVALPNDASEALHRRCGFERVGVLPEVGRKFDRWIDTAFYALRLGGAG